MGYKFLLLSNGLKWATEKIPKITVIQGLWIIKLVFLRSRIK